MKRTPLRRKTPLKKGKGFRQRKANSLPNRHRPSLEGRGPPYRGLKQKKRLKQVSDKRKKQNAEYAKLRKQFLIDHPHCQVCLDLGCNNGTVYEEGLGFVINRPIHVKATQVHHKARREGKLLLDTRFFLAVCAPHHRDIEEHGDWARRRGYLLAPEERRKL